MREIRPSGLTRGTRCEPGPYSTVRRWNCAPSLQACVPISVSRDQNNCSNFAGVLRYVPNIAPAPVRNISAATATHPNSAVTIALLVEKSSA